MGELTKTGKMMRQFLLYERRVRDRLVGANKMKKINLFIFSICSIPLLTPAALIRVEIDCFLEDVMTISGNAPSSGDHLSGWFEYEVPRLSDNVGDPLSWEFYEILTRGEVQVIGRVFPLDELSVIASRDSLSDDASWVVGFNAGTPLSQVDGDQFNRFSIGFTDNFQFLDDPSRLPNSFDEWDLLAADPTMIFSREGLDENSNFEQWTARSFTLTNLRISEVPEPSSVLILFLGAFAFLKRRRILIPKDSSNQGARQFQQE